MYINLTSCVYTPKQANKPNSIHLSKVRIKNALTNNKNENLYIKFDAEILLYL